MFQCATPSKHGTKKKIRNGVTAVSLHMLNHIMGNLKTWLEKCVNLKVVAIFIL